jgi:UDP-2-acetamido-3-amino-2,3-dideoxy-glucuronate N-acetyltransferase
MTTVEALAAFADSWLYLPNDVRVHMTAIIGVQPIISATFARPNHAHHPAPILGPGVVIGPLAIIHAGARIGEGTVVCPAARIREGVIIGNRCVIGAGAQLGYDVEIGDDCQIMDEAHITGGTVIGDRTFISQHVITANDDKPQGYRWKGVTPPLIGSDVVIGAGAMLRPGITIGSHAIIAMGAIVTKDVPAGATVKGLPARITEI